MLPAPNASRPQGCFSGLSGLVETDEPVSQTSLGTLDLVDQRDPEVLLEAALWRRLRVGELF